MEGTLQMCKDISANNIDDAFKIFYATGKLRNSVILYSSNTSKLDKMVKDLLSDIKERNKQVEDTYDQIIVQNVSFWDEIDGCLAVQCAEVTGGKFREVTQCIAANGWDYSVLADTNVEAHLSARALETLAMLYGL